MSQKFYRVKKDTFLWKAGAILQQTADSNGYSPIEDLWDATPVNGSEYISSRIVEHESSAHVFERVYKDAMGSAVYRTKEQLAALYSKAFKASNKQGENS